MKNYEPNEDDIYLPPARTPSICAKTSNYNLHYPWALLHGPFFLHPSKVPFWADFDFWTLPLV